MVQEGVAEDTDRLLVYYECNSTPVLCVEVEGRGEAAKIVRWSYSYSSVTGESGTAEGTEP